MLRIDSDLFKELIYCGKFYCQNDTFFRESISAKQRLFLTFDLSTGDSLKTISILFRIGQSTVQSIVFETCQAKWEDIKHISQNTQHKRGMGNHC